MQISQIDSTKTNFEEGSITRNGVVLPEEHPEDPSLYKVHFGRKTTDEVNGIEEGVWCINGINPFTRYLDINNTPISYGSYTPLQPYTPVTVTMSNGGRGMPTITGFAKTNTSIPDPENRNELHVLHKSPRGSMIAIDDNNGTVQIIHKKGETSIILGDDTISMEISNGDKSGKKADTFFSLSRGSFLWKMRDATMKFDESGFYVGDDDDSSYFKVTKDGIELHGNEYVKTTAKETVTMMSKEMTLEGTKDMSVRSSHLRVSGTQLLNLTGGSIGIEAIFSAQIKAMHISTKAQILHTVDTPNRLTRIPIYDIKTVGVYSEKSSVHTVKTSTWALGSSLIAADGLILTNMGYGNALSNSNYNIGLATTTTQEGVLIKTTTTMITKETSIAATNRVLTDTLAGTAKPAQEARGNFAKAKDKNNTKTINSVITTKLAKIESVMEAVSTVPNLVASAQSSLYRGNALGKNKSINLNLADSTGNNLTLKNNNSTFK